MSRFALTLSVLSLAAPLGCGAPDPELGELRQAVETRPARLMLSAAVVARLQARAQAGDAAWTALKSRCDGWATGTMHPPNVASANYPNVAQGYQGSDYYDVIYSLGLCYRTVRGVNATLEATYGAAGGRLLDAMSTPVASGGQPPQTDSGYGMRNYGVGMAVGFDWLYPALSAATKTRVVTAINLWVDWYDASGFSRNEPIGNYFAGYFLAKVAGALATEGDNARAPAYWTDARDRLWGTLVKPAFLRGMTGGGFPEGWQYGPRAVRAFAEAFWSVRTAKAEDWEAQLGTSFLRDQAKYLAYSAWPSMLHQDDQGTVRGPIQPPVGLLAPLAMTMEYKGGDSYAPLARQVAADQFATLGVSMNQWMTFLYWDPSLSRSAYTAEPLSYAATGPGHAMMRSDWTTSAVWGALASGPYINAVVSGEQLYNQGSLAVVKGDQPILINATGWLPQVAGGPGGDYVYDDNYGVKTRKLYNTFFVNDPANVYNPGQFAVTPAVSQTALAKYEERVGYVRARGVNIDDMYQPNSGMARPVTQFTRDLLYLRPDVFVLYDRTTVTAGGNDQWIAFHTALPLSQVAAADTTQRRHDIRSGATTVGSIRALLPRSTASTVVALPVGGVSRLEQHAPVRTAEQDWLTVVTASGTVPEQTRLTVADGNVLLGTMAGVHLRGARNQVVLFTADHAATGTTSAARYRVTQTADADHVLVDMAPSGTGYAVTATLSGGVLTVNVAAGGPFTVSAAGTMSFVVSTTGAVSQSSWGGAPPPPPPPPPPTGELLVDPSLETWTGNVPASAWTVTGTVTRYTGADAKAGSNAAQVASTTTGHGLSQSVTFATPKPAGTQVSASVWSRFRAGSTTSPTAQLIIEFSNGAPTATYNQSFGAFAGGAWVQTGGAVTVTNPVRKLTLKVISAVAAAQTFQVDSASLTAP